MRAVWSEERIYAADREARAVARDGGDGARAFAEQLAELDADEVVLTGVDRDVLCWRCRGDEVFASSESCRCGEPVGVTVAGEGYCNPCGNAVLREAVAEWDDEPHKAVSS